MYKIIKFSTTPFGYPTTTYIYELKEDGLYYDECGNMNFDKLKHKILSLEYKNKLYEVGKNDVEYIGFMSKVVKNEIINGFENTSYCKNKYLCIKTKNLIDSIWINVL